MIRLKNIKHNGDIIMCDAFLEDCSKAAPLIFHVSTKTTEPYKLPDGYGWCEGHIAKAKWHLLGILKNGAELPKERNLIWG